MIPTSEGSTISVFFDAVDEGPVGHLQRDLVALLHRVDVAEGGEVGGPVAGDRDRLALARHRRFGVVAGAELEARLVGPLDEDHVQAVHARRFDPAERVAGLRFVDQPLGELGDVGAVTVCGPSGLFVCFARSICLTSDCVRNSIRCVFSWLSFSPCLIEL